MLGGVKSPFFEVFMRIQDFSTFIPTEGVITLKNKKFRGWKIVFNENVDLEYYYNNERVNDFEESDDKYRLLMAMRQDDCWEKYVVTDTKQ